MAVQTVRQLFGASGRAGFDLTSIEVSADAGLTESWPNTGFEFLEVNNTSGGSITLTLTYNAANAQVDGVSAANKTVAIGAAKRFILGPFPTQLYNDVNGSMNIAWSASAGMKLAVFKLGPNN